MTDNKVRVQIYKAFKPIFSDEYRFLIYKGGRSSTKSWGIADSLILIARSMPARILCTREVQDNIEASSYQLLVDRIRHFDYNDFEITKTTIRNRVTGSSFIFAGLSDITGTAQGLKSIEGITHCWIEEGQTISKRSLELLIPSIRAKGSKIIVSYNPETEEDAVYTEFEKNPRPKTYICHINYLDRLKLLKREAPEMVEEAEFCKINKPEDYEHIWLGKPRNRYANTVVKYFTDENILDLLYLEDYPLHLTCDFNVDPMCWAIAHVIDDIVYFIDEIVIENTTTSECIGEFLNRYKDSLIKNKQTVIVNGDASGDSRSVQSEYSNYAIIKSRLKNNNINCEIRIKPYNPPIKMRVNAFNERILTNKGERKVFVSPKCERIIFNCKNLKYKEGTSIIETPTHKQLKTIREAKFLGHMFDAISYLVDYYFPVGRD